VRRLRGAPVLGTEAPPRGCCGWNSIGSGKEETQVRLITGPHHEASGPQEGSEHDLSKV
jgi:hypothetical protein